jgi:transcriptional regulator with XRE-family HTH domain
MEAVMPVDTRWFQDRVRDADLSQSRLARLLDIDKSALSHMFNNKRKMATEEAARIAEVLNLPLDDVLEHAGIRVPKGPASVAVIGSVDANNEIHAKKAGKRVSSPPHLPKDTVGLWCEDRGSILYGWTFYYVPCAGIAADALERLCVVRLASGAQYLFVPSRGFEPGVHNLRGLNGFAMDGQKIASASPVLQIKT